MKRVCFLLERGNPPRLNPVLAQGFARLEDEGIQVAVVYPEEELLRLDTLRVDADLYVLKSDTELALSMAIALECMGAKVLNRALACLVAKDKLLAATVMARAGIASPRSLAATAPEQLASMLDPDRPLILKPHRGYHGAGIAVAERPADLPSADAYPEGVFAQTYLSQARRDLKVFAIGDEIFGVRKAFSPGSFLQAGEPVELSESVKDLASRCGAAFGLELYGLDVAEDPHAGLQVIDLNYFPGYRGVPDADRRIADHIARKVRTA